MDVAGRGKRRGPFGVSSGESLRCDGMSLQAAIRGFFRDRWQQLRGDTPRGRALFLAWLMFGLLVASYAAYGQWLGRARHATKGSTSWSDALARRYFEFEFSFHPGPWALGLVALGVLVAVVRRRRKPNSSDRR